MVEQYRSAMVAGLEEKTEDHRKDGNTYLSDHLFLSVEQSILRRSNLFVASQPANLDSVERENIGFVRRVGDMAQGSYHGIDVVVGTVTMRLKPVDGKENVRAVLLAHMPNRRTKLEKEASVTRGSEVVAIMLYENGIVSDQYTYSNRGAIMTLIQHFAPPGLEGGNIGPYAQDAREVYDRMRAAYQAFVPPGKVATTIIPDLVMFAQKTYTTQNAQARKADGK